jgi:hypothetical protein
MRKLIVIFIVIVLITGCAKEYSFENPLAQSNVVTIGSNCTIGKILDYDTIARKNVATLQYGFNTTGNYPVNITETDSLTTQSIFQKSLMLTGDTLRIDANQYFSVDLVTNYRVRQFVGRENAYNPNAPIFTYNFIYNNAGQLITKTVSNPLQPGIIYSQTDYTYTAGNLTTIKSKIPINNITYYEATIAYNLTKQPKNFLQLLPDAPALKPYISGLHFGLKNVNEPKKITVKNSDQITGTLLTTTVTDFSNFIYSSDGYVLSMDAGGFSLNALPLANSRNKFQYFCR